MNSFQNNISKAWRHPIEARLETEQLPSLPSVAMEIVRLCRDESTPLNDLAAIVSVDASLATKILKVANSAKYRRRQQLTDLHRACFVLGMKTLKILALGFSIADKTSEDEETNGFPFEIYWSHSVSCAVAAREFAHLVSAPFEDEAFLCGLIGRIGQLAIGKSLGAEYPVLFPDGNSLPEPGFERSVLGFDHVEITERMLRKWNLPDLILQGATSWAVEPNDSPEPPIGKIVRLADHVARLMYEENKGQRIAAIYTLAEKDFGFSSEDVDGFIFILNDEIAAMAEILNVKLANRQKAKELVEEARQELIEISLDATMELESAHVDLERERKRNSRLKVESAELQKKWQIDALTGIPNRGALDAKLRQMVNIGIEETAANLGSVSVLMIDVDHFKDFNDTYGHLVGDKVLRCVAETVKNSLRPSDFVARYGGEEFVVILPDASMADLEHVGERTRKMVEDLKVENEGEWLQVTASFGGVHGRNFKDAADSITLIQRSDQCLYQAKTEGRNRCCFAEVDFQAANID